MTRVSPLRDPGQAVVAIPVCNEADRIVPCLLALSRQVGCVPPRVLLLVNNTTDGTTRAVRGLQAVLNLPIHAVEHDFPPALRSAGQARRLAMDHAAAMVAPDGVLLCTDADASAPTDWVAANLHHLRHGADAVAGRAVIDPVEALLIPQALHDADAEECAYAALLDEIDSMVDPDVADPWPRHCEHSGASIGVTLAAFRAAGGIPAVASGEDRAFFAALRRADARVRHAPEVYVTVSGRIEGRAPGGMADTIRRRMQRPDTELDEALEPARNRLRRARRRASVRFQTEGGGFGAAWQALEAADPALALVRVPVTHLRRETRRARLILHMLHRAAQRSPATVVG